MNKLIYEVFCAIVIAETYHVYQSYHTSITFLVLKTLISKFPFLVSAFPVVEGQMLFQHITYVPQ